MGKHHNIPSEAAHQLHESDNINNIITFNGQGCSGKTTQAKRLVKANPENYQRIHSYKLRSAFEDKVYNHLGRKHENIRYSDGRCQKLSDVEVLGIPTLAWLTAHFYKEVKPRMSEGSFVVLDHYLGDYYVDMLAGVDIKKFQSFVCEHLAIPDFNQGIHFYLDIDYDTYQNRWCKREGTDPPVSPSIFKERRGRYLELYKKGYLTCINATGVSKDKVAEKIAKEIEKKWPQ